MQRHFFSASATTMKVFGLTGGIATGKSTVRQMFEDQGVPCIDADVLAREVVEPGTSGFNKIRHHFGDEILQTDANGVQVIDRAKLGRIIFEDHDKRKTLNSITHKEVRNKMIQLLLYYFVKGEPSVILDVPLLYETGMDKLCHKVIVIYVPPEIQLKRLHERNPDLGEEAEKRIASQMSTEEKKKRTPHVIDNSGSLEDTKKQVDEMFHLHFPKSRIFILRNYIIGSAIVLGAGFGYWYYG